MKWIMGLLVPALLIIIAILILILKPKRNSWLGYRTQRSLSDDSVWHYSNKVMSISIIVVNLLICIPAICLINSYVKDMLSVVLLDVFTPLFALIAVIIITEYSIRRKFNNKKD